MNKGTHTDPPDCTVPLSPEVLHGQNQALQNSGGISRENAQAGFIPAFLDMATGIIYPSRFADGSYAPLHVLDGLPEELVVARDGDAVQQVKASVIAGFVREGRFYTRRQAVRWLNASEAN